MHRPQPLSCHVMPNICQGLHKKHQQSDTQTQPRQSQDQQVQHSQRHMKHGQQGYGQHRQPPAADPDRLVHALNESFLYFRHTPRERFQISSTRKKCLKGPGVLVGDLNARIHAWDDMTSCQGPMLHKWAQTHNVLT